MNKNYKICSKTVMDTTDPNITFNEKEVGKALLSNKYNFGLVKLNNDIFSFDKIFKCGNAEIKFFKPDWLNL